MQRDELAAWLRLALTPRLGAQSARALLAAFGLPAAIFGQSRDALAQVATAVQCDALLRPPEGLDAQLAQTWQWLQEAPSDVPRRLITLADSEYPSALLQMEDPPLMLFALGQLDAGFPDAGVAVVGSRNPTPQGRVNARAFARSFAEAGLTVVSGLALGVDAAAHEGALEGAQGAKGPPLATIAVVGTGLDRVYPKQNLALARRIAAQGAIVSEYLLGTPPLEQNFPRRNRIIAGLSRGTLVVEAALKSGSLITARLASEQGKDVFAIPGSIHSPQSRGCHALIKQGAKLVETAADVLEELGVAHTAAAPAEPAAGDGLLEALGHDPVSLDALIARTGLPAADLQARLLELELGGHAARLPGGLFQRISSA